MAKRKQQRPGTARIAADGMKLHRRVLRLDGRDRTVIGLRPGSTARFSTNPFHQTWHVLSDQHGARLLARLMWGLSYQARPDTILLIDRPFLTPTPFDADPADPIVLIPGWTTLFAERAVRDLKVRLPLTTPPDGTVRWRTFGLDRALADRHAWRRENSAAWQPERGRVERRCGVVFLRPGSPEEARQWAVLAAVMDPNDPYGTDYEHLGGPWERGYTGEIQIFRDFRRRVGVAGRARADVLAGPQAPADPQSLREAVWARGAVISGEAALGSVTAVNSVPTPRSGWRWPASTRSTTSPPPVRPWSTGGCATPGFPASAWRCSGRWRARSPTGTGMRSGPTARPSCSPRSTPAPDGERRAPKEISAAIPGNDDQDTAAIPATG
jgi:hypothetical protein